MAPRKTTLLQSIAIQFRVMGALLIREMNTRYGRENIGFLWVIGEPILFTGGVTIGWTLMRASHEHGLPVTAFVVTGYVPLTMWRHCVARGNKAFEANGSLLFHRQVTPLDIMNVRVALEVIGSLMAGLIVMVGATLLGYMDPPVDYGMLYLGLLFEILFCYASALIIACLSERSDIVERSIGVLTYLAIPFSGAFSLVDWVPQSFQAVLLWCPMVHNSEMIRLGQFGSAVQVHYNLVYDTWITGLLIMIGISLALRVRPHILVH